MQPFRIRGSLPAGLIAAVAVVASAQAATGGTTDFPRRTVRPLIAATETPMDETPEKFQAMVEKDFDLVRGAIASKQLIPD